MFDTCTSANRKIEEPLLTTFKLEVFTGYTTVGPGGTESWAPSCKYTRIRRAKYRYIGCTQACAVTKAKELNLLFNRKIVRGWTRLQNGYNRSTDYSFIEAADVTIVRNDNNSHDVVVTIDEELVNYNNRETAGGTAYWLAFEQNPDLVTNLFKFDTSSETDFEYDGII